MTTVVATTSSLPRAMAENELSRVYVERAGQAGARPEKDSPACGAAEVPSSPDEHHHKHYRGKRDY